MHVKCFFPISFVRHRYPGILIWKPCWYYLPLCFKTQIADLQMSNSNGYGFKWVEKINIGSVVEGEIQEKKEFGVVLNFKEHNDVVGFIAHHQSKYFCLLSLWSFNPLFWIVASTNKQYLLLLLSSQTDRTHTHTKKRKKRKEKKRLPVGECAPNLVHECMIDSLWAVHPANFLLCSPMVSPASAGTYYLPLWTGYVPRFSVRPWLG